MIIHDSNKLSELTPSKPRLIVLPFAGGNSYSYKDLFPKWETNYDIICPEIPGRGLLAGEPLLGDLHEITDFIYSQWITPQNLTKKYVLYGHSMGALLAYLLLQKINQNQLPLPAHVIVSGRTGPSIPKEEILHSLPSSDFWEKLQKLGGIPELILSEKELREYFEPILRSDFKAVETYSYTPVPPIDANITVMYGSEENMKSESLLTWEKESTRPVNFIEMPGNHFFIYENIDEITSCFSEIS